MSLSIVTEPSLIQPIFNPNIYRTLSNIYTATGYKYVFKPIVNGTDLTPIKPHPTPDNHGMFEVGKILKNYVTRSLNPTLTGAASTSGVVKYKVSCGEETAGGQITTVSNQATVVTLAISGNTTNALNGKTVQTLMLSGLTLSHAVPYYLKYNAGLYGVYRDSALTLPVTATGTFVPLGFIQTTDAAIASTLSYASTTGEKLAVDMVQQYDEFLNYNYSDYTLYGTDGKWLTKAPLVKDISADEYETLTFLQDYVINTMLIRITGYTASGVYIGETDIPVNLPIGYNVATKIFTNYQNLKLSVGIGMKNLYAFSNTNVTTNVNCAYYTVQGIDTENNEAGEIRRYNIIEHNPKYEQVRLAWRNSLGGMDFYTFNMLGDKITKVESSTYKQNLRYNYIQSDRGETVYHSQATESVILNSDYVDSDTADWFKELYLSHEIYIIDSAGKLTPMVRVSDSYNPKIVGKDKLKQYTIELRYAQKILSNL